MHFIYGENFANVMDEILYMVSANPDYITSPRNQTIKECLNVGIKIENPYENLFNNQIRSVPRKYLANELLLYFSGRNDAQGFEQASNFWGKIKNNDDTVNSAYGYLIFILKNNHKYTQWQWARQCLINDKDSRQAIMHYNRPCHQNINFKDFVCTLSNQFFIRDNKLHLTTYIRSNDCHFGVTFDFPFFMLLMQCMRLELLPYYPELELGEYTHFAASLHIYERNFNLIEAMNEYPFKSTSLPILKENPILNSDIIDMSYGKEYNGSDKFLSWLDENRS